MFRSSLVLRKEAIRLVCYTLLVAIIIAAPLLSLATAHKASAAVSGFVTRSGSKLMLNGQQFRFSGANIYWLGLDENVPAGTVDWPTSFRVDDALATVKEMGGTVVRAHTLGFSTGCSKCIEPSLGSFNEAALVKVDYAIKVAGDNGIRLILPLTDNYSYYHGGYHNFTDWRSLSSSVFWTNATVISDFEQFINVMLNRVNTYTGVAYKNDPTILAWETGNELGNPPVSWTTTIANYIKGIDSNHLVMDGNYGINTSALSIANVDMYSDHFYPMDTTKLSSDVSKMSGSNKVYYVGEYDWTNASALSGFLSAIQSNTAVSGDVFWSLFPHNDTYGYVQHGDCCTVHYPGDTTAMRTAAQAFRTHSYAMSGLSVPANGAPNAPVITSSSNPIAWKGSVGGDTYSIERSTDQTTWTVVCNKCVTDNNAPWNDSTRPSGTVYYRIQAFNLSGVAGPYSTNPSGGATATNTRPVLTNTGTGRSQTSGPTLTRTRTPTPPTVTLTLTRSNTPTITNTGTGPRTPVPTVTRTRTWTPTPAAPTSTITLTPPGTGTCSPVTATIAAPFAYDGAGAFCWQSSNLGAYINSWNLTSLTVNGMNYTDLYVAAGSYPAKINGYWYVSYTSAVSYGHFEAK
jgi:hypothetical protein